MTDSLFMFFSDSWQLSKDSRIEFQHVLDLKSQYIKHTINPPGKAGFDFSTLRPKIYPDGRWKKAELTINTKKNIAMMDCLQAGYIQYNQTVRYCYILFVFMVCSVFFPP